MFEDVDVIKSMFREEYRQVLYYLKHPNEYEGDYKAFLDKIVDFSTRIHENHDHIFRLKSEEE